jgi:hypothetical protein
MDIQKVIDRALDDPIFAAELAAKAGKASKARSTQRSQVGLHGDEWENLLAEFAESPQELAQLLSSGETREDAITTATTGTTTTTITTTTSLPCGITTTTTTTTTTTGTTTIFVTEQ